MESRKIISVFGSSRPMEGEKHYEEARSLGKALAEKGFTVVNGGYGGTMEASARGAKEHGGKTIGVVSRFFGKEANRWIDRKVEVGSLVDRLMELVSLADGYVILKGGTGTLLELASVWEFMNKSVIEEKPVVVLGPSWNGVLESLNRELEFEGKEACTRFITVVPTPEEAASFLAARLRKNIP